MCADVARWVASMRRIALATSNDSRPADGLGTGPYYPTDFDSWLRGHASAWNGPEIQKWVHYHEVYERHFARFRGTPVVLVEIGVKNGGSLALWRRYFGDAATIIGADLFDGAKVFEGQPVYGRPDRMVIGDQGDDQFWNDLKQALPRGELDILIDDGSHYPWHMIKSLEMTLPMLRPGGVYLCEDVHGAGNGLLPPVVDKFLYDSGRSGGGWVNGNNGTINAFRLGFEPRTNWFQRDLFGIAFYPFVVVVERMVQPRHKLMAPSRGKQRLNGSREHPYPLWFQRGEAAPPSAPRQGRRWRAKNATGSQLRA